MSARKWIYAAGTLAAFYLGGAFIAWELNPGQWSGDMRLLLGMFAGFVAAGIFLEAC